MTRFGQENLFIFLLLISASASETTPFDIPTLTMYDSNYYDSSGGHTMAAANVEDDLETYFYNQTLDHFNYRPESYATFRQQYVINSKHWGGPTAPIFVLLGAEAPFRSDSNATKGFVVDFASRFNSLLVYIEHRYYGESIPFGSREEAFSNASTLGYFNSQQAIADYAEIIIHVKEQFSAGDSPVIVFGGSYGGMLATWFRLKYPHIAIGALASSAPILYFDDITPQDGYYNVVTKDFMVIYLRFGNLSTLFYSTKAFNLTGFTDLCKASYGVPPRPHWVTTYYGGHSIRRVLKRFGSNIIFSNGLRDPYSSGGVLEDISDTIHAVSTINGSHCLDLYPSNGSDDPDWLMSQREAEINIIQGWLLTYYKDLQDML
ncbi:Lysosomal Pro-X carboxypeptidase [Linum grandiflorum]